MPYAKPKQTVAICNRSGQKMLRSEMVEDGYLRGLLVHPDWYDPPHPLESPFDPEEGIAIWKPAPDLMPTPPSPTSLVSSVGTGSVTFTFTQPDPPGSTVKRWELWRSPVQATPAFVKVATSAPIYPVDFFVSLPDLIGRDPSQALGGMSITDSTVVNGASYYYYVVAVTYDTSIENSDGLASDPAFINQNGVTVSGTPTGTGGPPGTTPRPVVALRAVFMAQFGATTTSYVYSPDGATWSIGTFPVAVNGSGVAYGGAVNKLWVAMGAGGQVALTSPDGVTWTQRATALPTPGTWNGVAWSPALNLFVAVDSINNAAQAATSPDGITWTSRATPAGNFGFHNVIWSPTANLFIAGFTGSFATTVGMTSPDGINWTLKTVSGGANAYVPTDFGSAFNLFIRQSGGTTYAASADLGATWASKTNPSFPGGSNTDGAIHVVAGVAYSVSGTPARLIKTTVADLASGWSQVSALGITLVTRVAAFSPTLGMWAMTAGANNFTQVVTTSDGATLTIINPTNAVAGTLDQIAAAV